MLLLRNAAVRVWRYSLSNLLITSRPGLIAVVQQTPRDFFAAGIQHRHRTRPTYNSSCRANATSRRAASSNRKLRLSDHTSREEIHRPYKNAESRSDTSAVSVRNEIGIFRKLFT